MREPAVLVTCPMLRARRRCTVDGSRPAVVQKSEVELLAGPLAVARAVRQAGAQVSWISLCEPELLEPARSALAAMGADHHLIPAPAASVVETAYLDAAGVEVWSAVERRVPPAGDVDRLLDEVAKRVSRAELVVVAGDLEGSRRCDFTERVVGRAWGFGVKTACAEGGEALKQALHTQPLCAVVAEQELAWVAPAKKGAVETEEQTLRRIFEDPVKLLLITRVDGRVTAACAKTTTDVGWLGECTPGELAGAVAARLAAGDEPVQAARRAIEVTSRGAAAKPAV